MKSYRRSLLAATLLIVANLSIAAAEVNVNVHVGVPAPVVVAPPPPPARTVIIEDIQEPPDFILPSPLGFYVAVGLPYDLVYIDSTYYMYRDNGWYRAPHYRGPWKMVKYRHLPPGLRRHKLERVRYYRDEEYHVYQRERDHYRGRHFRPEKEWKEHRKEEKERRKEEKRWEKEERKREKHGRHGDD
jgi:YXWGXW repeat-containing protein